jgi:formylglycine-generating enzyme required for sulfatase activity
MIELGCQVRTQLPETIISTQSPKEITNSVGMKLVLIPKGMYMMGFEEGGDKTKHEVTISKDYYLGVTEVTQGQYEKVMGTNPSYFQGDKIKGSSSNHPVEQVSWEDAIEFCKKISELPEEKKAGRVYRLPTEAEWEYACRAGSKTAYSFGESLESLGDYAWFSGNSNQTNPVGEKKANAWGLYDMHGNVLEWCSDSFGDYPQWAFTDPVRRAMGSDRGFRGGSWSHNAAECRSAHRISNFSKILRNYGGFRVALSSSSGITK